MAYAPTQLRARFDRLAERSWWRDAPYVAVGLLGAAVSAWLVVDGNIRLAVAGALLVLLGGAALARPPVAIVGTLIFLAVLGDLRRALIPFAGWTSEDPLLLVGPVVASLLVLSAFVRRDLRVDTPIARCLAFVMVLMVLQVFNPQQRGLRIGLAGTLFTLVPLLWFWIGRTYLTPAFVTVVLYRIVPVVAMAAAVLGLVQVFHGFFPFESEWTRVVSTTSYVALNVSGHIRPFAFFTSAAEYAQYLALGLMALWAGLLRPSPIPRPLVLVMMLFMAIALVLASSRGIIVTVLAAGTLLWALQSHSRAAVLQRLALALAIVVAGLAWVLAQAPRGDLSGRAGELLEHQIVGLRYPLDPKNSTTQAHFELLLNALTEGIRNPLGHGLGVTSLAASRFGGRSFSSEVDVGNAFVSLGLVGGIAYAATIGLILITAVRYWARSRSLIALAMVGILTASIGQWLIGGLYAVSALIWLSIGALDRFQHGQDE
jgi:hypothetical protein